MIDFTLRQLRYAIALADEGHFGRAASTVHVTQPALSQQIRLLEDQCGTPIFERLGRAVRATPFGQEFLMRAREVVREADMLAAFAGGHAGQPDRPIRFGLIPTVAPYLLPEIYPALQSSLPDLEFAISESRTEQLLAALDNGNIDIALIATDPPDNARLTSAPLFADPFVLASEKKAGIAAPAVLSEIPRERILLLDEGHCLRDQAIDACALRDDDASRTFAATSLSTIVEFVANGQGVTLLPAISLRKEAKDSRIGISQLASPGAGRLLRLVWRQTTPFEKMFRQIAEVIREAGNRQLAEPLPNADPAPPAAIS